MANLSITNTLSNGATILASEHNTNYSDIVTYINNRNSGSSTWDAVSISHSSNIPLTLNNSTGTQDIFRCQDNGSNVFVIADGGYITTINQSACRVYRNTSNQTISSGSETKIQFNGESYDVKSEFDSATNYRFTANVAGKYLICCSVRAVPTVAGTHTLTLKKNGSSVSTTAMILTTLQSSVVLSDTIDLAATDYLELFFTQDTGSDVDLRNGSELSYMAIHKIS